MDIDIDFKDREDILPYIQHVPAIVINGDKLTKHVCGVYIQDMPTDERGWATIPYREAEAQGWFKIDFLNNSTYRNVKSEDHLNDLLSREPDWDMLLDEKVTSTLPQVGGHHALLVQMRPRSIPELAMTLALIRPGKRHLVGKSWDEIESVIWDQTEDAGFAYKKSHAIAFAMSIVVVMNLHAEITFSEE